MPAASETVSAADPSGTGVRVRLTRQGDRYAHAISLVAGGVERLWLESIEGPSAGSPDWPSSPPLQQCSVETRGAERVALCLGMAGQSVWSASIESLSARRILRFDLACRIRTVPDWLGNQYVCRLGDPIPMTDRRPAGEIRWAWRMGDEAGNSSVRLPSGCVLALVGENGTVEYRPELQQVIITPRYPQAAKSTTVRWGFEMRIES